MVSSLRQRELGRLLGCGWIKQALFIGPLSLCSALIRGCVWACSLKCLRDLLTPRRREPLRPHTGLLQPPQRMTRAEAVIPTVHMLSSWLLQVTQFVSILVYTALENNFSLSLIFPSLLLLSLPHQTSCLIYFCPCTHSENNALLLLCFPMVLALECVPVKGDIYLPTAERERLHYCLIQIERKSRGWTPVPRGIIQLLLLRGHGWFLRFVQLRLLMVNLITTWQQQAACKTVCWCF